MKDLLITKWRTLSVGGGKDDVEVSLYTWLCLSS